MSQYQACDSEVLSSSGRGRTLPSGFCSQVFPEHLATSGFAGGLLSPWYRLLLTYSPSPLAGMNHQEALILESGGDTAETEKLGHSFEFTALIILS